MLEDYVCDWFKLYLLVCLALNSANLTKYNLYLYYNFNYRSITPYTLNVRQINKRIEMKLFKILLQTNKCLP